MSTSDNKPRMTEGRSHAVYKPVRYRSLATIALGGKAMRFLGVNEENQGVHFPKSPINCPGQLLFLGTDVLAGTAIQRKNHIRVHARFAKIGLASKVRLAGFKIESINNSTIMWFYSIKGLFRVAFEIGSEALQKDCLTMLQSEWIRRCADPLLRPESMIRYNLRLKMDIMQNWDNSLLSEKRLTGDSDEDTTFSDDSEPHTCNTTDADVSNDGYNDADNLEDEDINANGFLERLNTHLGHYESKGDEETKLCISKLSLVVDYLQNMVNNKTFQESEFALFEMMKEYSYLMTEELSGIDLQDTFGLCKEKYTLLYIISDWLGNEFKQLEPQIAEKVEFFKTSNIQNLDSLPPSEQTIDSLFPQCMKKLLTNWLGEEDMNSVNTDHDYCPDSKRPKTDKERTKYPLVQLVLEFVTNSLISGVSHVVYSRLRTDGQRC